ncbi:RNA polymerase sigma factor [Burkholderia sp. ABCPW 111]|uniref:RNA polymerase sigma factor n=1 Tax=Burkholderia sp. ABCPW 111 TaxID=1820025 RepID=UPI0005313DF9|nr:RNA polymerase sigma factor [Burkholderia sp. ABCPW 111]KGR99235.1 RNA polymerase sigma factor, sigma-70 family protein [Burkholderia sp. ABCPW 111]
MTNSATAFAQNDADDERLLARRIAAGDQSAFELLMRRHNWRLFRIARATLHSNADAQDALQDAYLSAYRAIGEFRGEAALFTWLARLVLNECFARLRRHARRQRVVPIVDMNAESEIDAMCAHDPDPSYRAAARAELRGLLEQKLERLPYAFRIVFVLRSVEELSVDETAHCLGIPEATVRSRHFRAKRLLRDALAREIGLVEHDVFEFGGGDCDRLVAAVMRRVDGESGR